jgi:hypothetical protein
VLQDLQQLEEARDLLRKAYFEERSKVSANAKSWDKWLLGIYNLLLIALLITAALDACRFRKSTMPPTLQAMAWWDSLRAER